MAKIVHLERLTSAEYFKDSALACIVREMHDAPSNETIAMHDHEFSELVLVASGSLNHIYSGGTVRLRTGDFFVIHPGEKHGYASLARGTVVFNILYHSAQPPPALALGEFGMMPEFFPKDTSECRTYTLGRVPRRELAQVTGLIREIRREEKARSPLGRAVCHSLFAALLLRLSRAAKVGQMPTTTPIQAEIDFIMQNLERKITLKELCGVSGKSVSTLSREFKRLTGRSPGDYVIEMRVAKARSLLTSPKTTLDAVAHQTGFCSASHLSRTLSARR
ncbi:MAG: helix-turn-helix domain-containing protein [Kiritimatiellae bacterium]|nr:helix-turn-helix domain-containing protein [Kiritimatiellia bacterium]